LDEQAQITSYEEYTPYGCASYQAVRSQIDTPKRFRYTGKERDEESGLYYHGARYYAPWFGRWASCDPAGLFDGANSYSYCRGNPITRADRRGLQSAVVFTEEDVRADPEAHIVVGHRSQPPPQPIPSQEGPDTSVKQGARPVVFSLQAMDIALRDLYKLANVRGASDARLSIQVLTPAEASKAAALAREVSDLRNILRAATQEKLTPAGRVLSRLLEKDRSWASIVKKYGDPFDSALPAEQRMAIADKIAAASAKSSRAMNALQAFGKGLMVLNVAVSSWQVGSGVTKIRSGQTGEGVVDIAEGTANVGLTIGTYAGVKSGAIAVKGGVVAGGATVGAGVLAAGGLALGFEEARRALRGERTAALEATEDWADLVVRGDKQGGFKGFLMQAGGWTGGFFSTLIAVGQGN
jgi:RHS repeat-associated protein